MLRMFSMFVCISVLLVACFSKSEQKTQTIILEGKYSLLEGEKLKLILTLAPVLEIEGAVSRQWFSRKHYNSAEDLDCLLEIMPDLVKPALLKKGDSPRKKEFGFVCLFTDGEGNYRLNCSRGFHTSLNESLSSLETLIDELGDDVDIEKKHVINQCYRRLSDYHKTVSA